MEFTVYDVVSLNLVLAIVQISIQIGIIIVLFMEVTS